MKRKIANQFLANYLLMFIISILLSFGAFLMMSFAGSVLDINLKKNTYTASSLMKDQYVDIDFSSVAENGGGAQIIDQTGSIVMSKGINTFKKDRYTMSELTEFFTASQRVGVPFSYNIAYNEKMKFWLVVTFPTSIRIDAAIAHNSQYPSLDTQGVAAALTAVILFYLLILTAVTFVYSKLSSISIIKPLRELSESVRAFRDGNYAARVRLKQKNEFAEIQNAFNDMAERIEQETAMREHSENNRKKLIADISHDLKTPLANIMGYADILIKEQNLSSEQRSEFLRTIYDNSARAAGLMTDMLELSKLDSPEFKLQAQRTDVCEFLRRQIIELIPELDQAGYSYDWRIPETEIFTNMDARHMKRVFQNLVANTIRHTPKGTHIDIFLTDESEFVTIIYQDNGGGIPADIEASLFNPFVRADTSRHTDGTGLGLAIVKKIIDAHGGTIHLNNDKGTSCSFVITLEKI